MEVLQQLATALQEGNDSLVSDLTKKAIEQNIDAQTILDKGLIGGMDVIGKKFGNHEIFLPDVLIAARAMHAGMDELKPLLTKSGLSSLGKVVIGTVKGDLHDIGKNLVGIMLKGAGFEVIDLGKGVECEKFVETAEKEGANVIGMSALLTTTMFEMKGVNDLLKEKGLKEKIKTIVGGAPITEEFSKEIGADAYGFDAANAVENIKKLI